MITLDKTIGFDNAEDFKNMIQFNTSEGRIKLIDENDDSYLDDYFLIDNHRTHASSLQVPAHQALNKSM